MLRERLDGIYTRAGTRADGELTEPIRHASTDAVLMRAFCYHPSGARPMSAAGVQVIARAKHRGILDSSGCLVKHLHENKIITSALV